MAFSRRTWDQARLFYEAGVPPKIICERLGVTTSQICRHAKLEGWVQVTRNKNTIPPELFKSLKKVDVTLEKAIVEKKINKHELKKEASYFIHSKACQVQSEILDVIIEAREAISNFVKSNPNGVYVKKDGKEDTTYGLVSEVFSPISSILNATSIFTHDKRGISVTNNTQINQNSDQPMATTAPIIIEFNGK